MALSAEHSPHRVDVLTSDAHYRHWEDDEHFLTTQRISRCWTQLLKNNVIYNTSSSDSFTGDCQPKLTFKCQGRGLKSALFRWSGLADLLKDAGVATHQIPQVPDFTSNQLE